MKTEFALIMTRDEVAVYSTIRGCIERKKAEGIRPLSCRTIEIVSSLGGSWTLEAADRIASKIAGDYPDKLTSGDCLNYRYYTLPETGIGLPSKTK